MPQTDSEIIQQWDTYIHDYEEKYQSVVQEYYTIINDPNASNERKAQAIRDVEGQGDYLNQLKANKALLDDAYAQGQPLPNITFNVNGAGIVCKKSNDNTIYPLVIETTMTATELHYARAYFFDIYQYTDTSYYGRSWTDSFPGKITPYKAFNSSNAFIAFGHSFAQTGSTWDSVGFRYMDADGHYGSFSTASGSGSSKV